jgi:carboxypeptidase C (cathepsin A)
VKKHIPFESLAVGKKEIFTLWVTLVLLSLPFGAGAEQAAPTTPAHPPTVEKKKEATPAKGKPGPPRVPVEEKIVATKHSAVIDGNRINYTVRTGTLVLKQETGKPEASVFFVAYLRDNVPDPNSRPITFAFNGGPGSSSVWLHLGALGPRRIKMEQGGLKTQRPPFSLTNNEYSILDFTDLVFIDPVSTGYSRAVSEKEAKKFHGVREDVRSVSDFIRLYVTRTKRWLSPKFLFGESYGATRAAGLAHDIQERQGMYLNGVVLMSAALNFQTISFDRSNDLPYILILPSYTAAAWYHHRLPEELQQLDLQAVLAKAEHFALGDYAQALLAGSSLPEPKRKEIVSTLSRLTGISASYIEQSRLRLPAFHFEKELLRDKQQIIGRFDSRFTGPAEEETSDFPDYDPSYSAVQGIFTAAFNDYVRVDLGFKENLPYEILNPGRVQPWNYGKYKNRYLDVTGELQAAMHRQPDLKVLFATGYFDLATPFFGEQYTIDHLELTPDLRRNVLVTYYRAGHMMYLHEHSLAKLRLDLIEFYSEALGKEQR